MSLKVALRSEIYERVNRLWVQTHFSHFCAGNVINPVNQYTL